MSETRLGLAPAQIAPMVVARIGLRHARRLALTGRTFDGAEATAIGLSDVHCDNAEAAEAEVAALLGEIGRCAPGANAATKALLLGLAGQDEARLVDGAAELFVACLCGEGREGIAAFVAKRPPNWVDAD